MFATGRRRRKALEFICIFGHDEEQLLWVRHFQSIPELLEALQHFRELYNQNWLIERLGFQSPVQARQRLALEPAA